MLENLLKTIGLPQNAIKVYLRLLELHTASARKLAENLGIPRASVYDNLNMLIKQGLVVERNEDNKRIFQVDEIKNLKNIVRSKIDELQAEEKNLIKELPQLSKQINTVEPKIKFYPGVDGVKQVLNDLVWYDNIEVLSMWFFAEMREILGIEYLEKFQKRCLRENISRRTLLTEDKQRRPQGSEYFGIGKEYLHEVRIAPKNIKWKMGYTLYADKAAFISSRDESFGFIVHSADFYELQKAQFEAIWQISKPLK